jgi:hypothetical protein
MAGLGLIRKRRVVNRKGPMRLSHPPEPLAREGARIAGTLPRPPKKVGPGRLPTAKARAGMPGATRRRLGASPEVIQKRLRAGKAFRRQPRFENQISELSRADWAELLRKLALPFRYYLPGKILAVKGLLYELRVRHLLDFRGLLARCTSKVAASPKWRGSELFIVRGARGPDGREVGDYLIVAFDRRRNPKDIWVLAIIESKSQRNAASIVKHTVKPVHAKTHAERLSKGQPRQSLERINAQGIDLRHPDVTITAVDPRASVVGANKAFKPGSITAANKTGTSYPPTAQTTELIGVIPKDVPSDVRGRVLRDSPRQGIQVWFHETPGIDKTLLSYEMILAYSR